jgi:acetaldehyde dehydrogenase/alcohol dehydrogenase
MKIKRDMKDVIISKTFDNRMIFDFIQLVIVDKEVYEEGEEEFQKYACYIVKKSEL